MKKALLNNLEPGRVCEVVDVGNEFEVADTFSWVDCPDDVTTSHTVADDGSFIPFDPLTQPGFAENGYKVARSMAYLSIGDQLDMLYKELQSNGNITTDGNWFNHVASVKAAIPKDDPAAVLAWNIQWLESLQNPPE